MRTTSFPIMEEYQRESGETWDALKAQIRNCNPNYVEFLERKVEEYLKQKREERIPWTTNQ